MSYLLAELQRVGIVDTVDQTPEADPIRYAITDPDLRAALADLLAVAISRRPQGADSPPTSPPPEAPASADRRAAGREVNRGTRH
jgi:hypothetical protein